jgi:hypothetical protein
VAAPVPDCPVVPVVPVIPVEPVVPVVPVFLSLNVLSAMVGILLLSNQF